MTRANEQDDTIMYKVVLNHEDQYSIWPADRESPLGWREAGKTGNKQECLDHIEQVWTDLTPRSLRERDSARVTVALDAASR